MVKAASLSGAHRVSDGSDETPSGKGVADEVAPRAVSALATEGRCMERGGVRGGLARDDPWPLASPSGVRD